MENKTTIEKFNALNELEEITNEIERVISLQQLRKYTAVELAYVMGELSGRLAELVNLDLIDYKTRLRLLTNLQKEVLK